MNGLMSQRGQRRALGLVSHMVFLWGLWGVAQAREGDIASALRELRAARHSPRAALFLWSLEEVLPWSSAAERAEVSKSLRALKDDRRTPLDVRRLAARLLRHRLEAEGRTAEARELDLAQGNLTAFFVLGPFSDPAHGGIALPLPLDDDLAPGPDPRALPRPPLHGLIRLDPLFGTSTDVVAFAQSAFRLKQSAAALVHAGCDDACNIWIDGGLVLCDPGVHDLAPDARAFQVQLGPGAHRVLVKVAQGEGAMGFTLSLTDPAGRPLPLLDLPASPADLRRLQADSRGQPPPRAAPKETLADWFEARAAGGDEAALAEAGFALFHTSARDEHERRAAALIAEGLGRLRPEDPRRVGFALWLARVSDSDSEARAALEEAAGLSPKAPAIWYRLALRHQVRGEALRGLALVAKALAADPHHLPSLTAEVELLQDVVLTGRAGRLLSALVTRSPDVPAVLEAAGSLYRRRGERVEARRIFERLVGIDATDSLGLRALHELDLEAGDVDGALRRLEQLEGLDPLRLEWRLQHAALLAANGRPGPALEVLSAAEAICPESSAQAAARGEVLVELGRVDDARRAYEQALRLAPHDQSLERRLARLRPSGAPFFEPYEADFGTLVRAPVSPEASFAETLTDRTVVRLHPNGMSSRFRQQVVRVLDARGVERLRRFRVEYAPGRQEVRVLRSRLVRKDGQSDAAVLVDDRSLSEPWFNLFYDVHAREITFPGLKPGDTIELVTLTEDTGPQALLPGYFGDFVALQGPEPVQDVRYTLLAPPGLAIAVEPPPPQVRASTTDLPGGGRRLSFEAGPRPAVEPEPGMPGFAEVSDLVQLSTFAGWRELGVWFEAQIQDALVAEPAIRTLSAELISGQTTRRDQIRAIYRFVADSIRYVGLEFGVHSYIPYRAREVLERRYGDCKDKAALMVALLRAAGIEARLALLRMARLGRVPGAGGAASLAIFNHAVCYVPSERLWLDGTASLHGLEDLPGQDQGVQALIIGPEGSSLAETPRTGPERNRTEIDLGIELLPDGEAAVDIRLMVQGSLAPEMRLRLLSGRAQEDVLADVLRELFPEARIEGAEVSGLADPDGPLTVTGRLVFSSLVKRVPGGLELPALAKETSYQRMLASLQTRRHDLVLGPAWEVRWRTRLKLPPGARMAPLDQASLQEPFAAAAFRASEQDGTVAAEASLKIVRTRIEALRYARFRELLGQIDRLFSQRIHLLEGPRAALH